MMIVNTGFVRRKIRAASLRIFNFIENNGCADFYKNGEEKFLMDLLEHFSKTEPKKVIFDIGANVGDYSALALELARKKRVDLELHLFEPTKSCFTTLEKRFRKNNNNLKLNNFGVSDVNSESVIFYDQEQSGMASIYQRNLTHYNLQLDLKEEIQLRRLDNYINEHDIAHIDFIKIDIEGHELRALEGGGDYIDGRYIDYIQFEYGGANLDSCISLMDIYAYLESRNFLIAKIMRNGIELREYRPYMEHFEYSNYVAISKNILR